jgi:hypothetical protein
MGFDGGHRAGYMQVAGIADAVMITSTMGKASCSNPAGWGDFVVISSYAAISTVDAPGLTNDGLFSSDQPLPLGSKVSCAKIVMIGISGDSTGHKVIAHNRILL